MTHEINKRSQRRDIVMTDIVPNQFKNFFDNLLDEIELSTVSFMNKD